MNKKGMVNVSVMFLGIVMILSMTIVYMLYFQVGMIIDGIKEELFYVLMNGQVSFDKDELALTNYEINKNKLEERLNLWVRETAKSKINVEEIRIKELLTNTAHKKATLKLELLVTFKPIVKIRDKVTVQISDEIDLSLLKLK